MVSTHVSSQGIVWELGARDPTPKHNHKSTTLKREDYVIIQMPPRIDLKNDNDTVGNKHRLIHNFINFVKFILYI